MDSLQRAANMRSNLLGDHEDTADSFYWLGQVQREAGDLTTALESAQLSLRLRKELLGAHIDTAAGFHQQGVTIMQ